MFDRMYSVLATFRGAEPSSRPGTQPVPQQRTLCSARLVASSPSPVAAGTPTSCRSPSPDSGRSASAWRSSARSPVRCFVPTLLRCFVPTLLRCFVATQSNPPENLRGSGHRLPTALSQRRHICRNRSMGPRLDRHPSDDAVAHHHDAGLAVRSLGAPPAHRRLESLTIPGCRKFGRIELSASSSTAGGADITGLGSLGRHLQS
jgi:hypothetical protein